jgi:hypothetical protein
MLAMAAPLLWLPLMAAQSVDASGAGPFVWQAQWIAAKPDPAESTIPPRTAKSEEAAKQESPAPEPLPLFRYGFELDKKVAKATLRICGLGQYEAHVNGQNVSGQNASAALLTPGWTDYRKRVLFDTYDVTGLLVRGGNAMGVMLGNGMFRVEESKGRYTKFAGSLGQPRLIAQLDVDFADGSHRQIHLRRGRLRCARGAAGMGQGWTGQVWFPFRAMAGCGCRAGARRQTRAGKHSTGEGI